MIKVSKTINNWLEEIVNSQKGEKYNNGFTEANNNKIGARIDIRTRKFTHYDII